MKKILVFRHGLDDQSHTMQILKDLGLYVCDIHHIDLLAIEELNSKSEVDIRAKGIHINEFDHIFYLGMPKISRHVNKFILTEDEQFVNDEYHSVLMSTLFAFSYKLINKGLCLSLKHLNDNPSDQTRWLSKIGWRFPNIQNTYWMEKKQLNKIRSPEPGQETQRYSVTITQHQYFFQPFQNIYFDAHEHLENIISNTQNLLRYYGIDWLTVFFSEMQDEFYGYGFTTHFPQSTDYELQRQVLSEVFF